MLRYLKNLCIAGAFFASVASAGAALSGQIHLSSFGATAAVDFSGNTVTFSPGSPSPNAIVGYADGDFSPLFGSFAVYEDFTYDPLPVGGYTPIWQIVGGTASFDLLSIDSVIEDANLAALSLSGTGTLHFNGQSQSGSWTFSASKTLGQFQFGSTNATTAVPDGGTTVALFGFSLLGLQIVRRRLSKK